ncbi:MAG TPA: GAF domain-containing protein [Thermomicrobiaceae bacterium]|nr:GAF domain-containing protein [Thermomicrobiaceae bacterium]
MSTVRASADLEQRTRTIEQLRAGRARLLACVVEPLSAVAEPYRAMTPESREAIIGGYIDALIEAIERDCIDPFLPFLDRIEPYWAPSGLSVAEVIRGIQVLGDACRETAGGEAAAIDQWTRRSTALIAERAVSAVNRQLEEELAWHRENEERLLGLQRVSAAVHSELDLQSVLAIIVEEAQRLTSSAAAVIRLVDEESGHLRLIARSDDATALFGDVMPVDGSLSGLSFRTGTPIITNDLPHDSRLAEEMRGATPLSSLLIVPLIVRDTPIGVIAVAEREGGFSEQDERLLSLFADQAAAAIEHARLYEHAQRRIAEMGALQRISSVISSSLDIDEVFEAIYQEIAGVMPTDALLIGLSRTDGLIDLEFIVDGNERYAPRHAQHLSGPMRRALTECQPVVIGDIAAVDAAPMYRVGHPRTRVRSVAAAPMLQGGEAVGLLSAQSYTPYDYTASDARLLMTIANHAVVAIEHARLYAQAQHLAVAEERNRLAREIHDTLAQGLIGISLYLEQVELALPEDDAGTRRLVERALTLTRSNLEEARRSVKDLRAAQLEGRSLLEGIGLLLAEQEADGVFRVELKAPLSLPPLEPPVETALYRVIQEALTNCRKHARCQRVTVRLALDDDRLLATITDDGQGFDPERASAEPNRFGLASMRERIERVGGELWLESTPGRGTTIRASVPRCHALAVSDD